jgi:membrane associated rhomboid family serine protease
MRGTLGRIRRFPRFTLALIALNVFVFLVDRKFPLTEYGALSVEGIRAGRFWQLFTFQFLHAHEFYGFHLLLNCWGIFIFGPPLESVLKARRLCLLYLFSGVMGGLLQIVATILAHKHFSASVVGASAGVFGLMAAFASLYPDARMTLLLFFVFPVDMTANRVLTVAAIITVLGMVYPNWLLGTHVAHAAHLGGLIGGLIMARLFLRRYRQPTGLIE